MALVFVVAGSPPTPHPTPSFVAVSNSKGLRKRGGGGGLGRVSLVVAVGYYLYSNSLFFACVVFRGFVVLRCNNNVGKVSVSRVRKQTYDTLGSADMALIGRQGERRPAGSGTLSVFCPTVVTPA